MANHESIADTVRATVPEIVALRRELHQHPEVRFQEQWTSGRIARFLDEAGCSFESGHGGGTGLVACIEGKGPKTVALRADMDALEIQEETGLPYASQIPDRMHACGHDGHMAGLCGAIKVLLASRDLLKGTVKFIFQPGEEQVGGAKGMVEEGVMDGVDVVFGLHGWPNLPLGCIGIKPGRMMASADFFSIEVEGQGCHGAQPHVGVDPVIVAAHIATALQTVVSRELDPREPAVVSVTQISAGSGTNIIPANAILKGTVRAFSPDMCTAIRNAVIRIAENTAQAFRATARVKFGDVPYPALSNDAAAASFVRETVCDVLGVDKVIDLEQPTTGAEDFAFYLQRAPGAFFFLGLSPEPTAPRAPLHSPQFDFNDDALPAAIMLFAHLALRYLAQD